MRRSLCAIPEPIFLFPLQWALCCGATLRTSYSSRRTLIQCWCHWRAVLIFGKRQLIFLGVVSLLAHYLCIVVDFISNYEIIKVKFSNIELLLITLFIAFLHPAKRRVRNTIVILFMQSRPTDVVLHFMAKINFLTIEDVYKECSKEKKKRGKRQKWILPLSPMNLK